MGLYDKEWLNPRSYLTFGYRVHTNNRAPSSSNRIFILNYWCLLRFDLNCSYTIRKLNFYTKKENIPTFETEVVHRPKLKEREMSRLTTYFYFLSLALCMSTEYICKNSILLHSGSDISEQAFVNNTPFSVDWAKAKAKTRFLLFHERTL